MRNFGSKEALAHNFPLVAFLFLSVALSGCVIVPLPSKVSNGQRYSKEALRFLDLPDTTRNEVVATLGEPLIEHRETRTLVYEWETTPRAFVMSDDSHITHGYAEPYCLFIGYNAQGLVTGHAIREVFNYDLKGACEQWERERKN